MIKISKDVKYVPLQDYQKLVAQVNKLEKSLGEPDQKGKKEEISAKDISKIIDSIEKLDKRLREETVKLDKKTVEEAAKLDKKLSKQVVNNENQIKSLDNNFKAFKSEMSTVNKKLSDEMAVMNKKLSEDMSVLNKKMTAEMSSLQKAIELNQKQMQDQMKNQEEIITSMIKKFEEKFQQDKSKLIADIEELKNQQDVLKISFTFNEKQLLQKMQATINEDIKKAVKGKEKEVLMKFWIQDLKAIVNDFEKLKKMHPKEFTLQLNEIASTIQVFRQKLSI